MKTQFVIVILSVTLLYSCKKTGRQFLGIDASRMEEIIIDPKDGIMLPIDSFIDKSEYIKLETTDDNLIGEISQILFTDSLLIVVDAKKAQTINVFDMQGNYKYKIGQRGGGPAEFITITNVSLVPNKNQIAVLDGPQHRVIHYTYKGEYINSERIPFMLYYYEYLKSGYKAFNTSNMRDPAYGKYRDNVLIVTDEENQIIYGACNDFYSQKFSFTMNRPLRIFGNEVYLSPNFTDVIFLVSDTLVTAKYHINIREHAMPPLSDHITNERFGEYIQKYFHFNGDFIELDKLTFMNISAPQGNPFLVYVHQTKRSYLNSGNVYHPFYAFLNTFIPKARYKENVIVTDVPAYHIIASKENLYHETTYKKELDDLYKDLTEDANPVLFFYHLREDL
ncbi:MAG: 6-bladed beta-propeller [Bacteroidales bacterium]|jgi:hypothetical protein|nr:6-bladed beta-propeller [Bacteroidales bacterium]